MKTIKISLLFILLLFINNISAQTYTENTSTTMLGLEKSTAAWADYNNDGYLDVVYSGYIGGVTGSATYLYKSNGSSNPGTFTEEVYSGFEHLSYSNLEWVDYNNDGNMDLFICGINYLSEGEAKLYKNLGAAGNYTFAEVTGLDLNYYGSASWGDYNNDGLSDLMYNDGLVYTLYKNNGNDVFSKESVIQYHQGMRGSSVWGDINNDGFLDVVLSAGLRGSTQVYVNNGPNSGYTFSNTNDTIYGGFYGKMDLGDYDNDGDLDLLISAYNNGGNTTDEIWLYKNENGNFENQLFISFVDRLASKVQWADYDNDGDLDIMQAGKSYGYGLFIYRNNGNDTFVEEIYPVIDMNLISYSCWVDYNNDGMLDIFAIGEDSNNVISTKIYDCSNIVANQAPTAPTNVSLDKSNPLWKLSWNPSTDDKSSLLTYNIMVGTTANGLELNSPESDSLSGFRKVFYRGLIQDTFCFIEPFVHGQSCDDLYISVQSIDQGGIGSAYGSIANVNDWAIAICPDTIILLADTAYLNVFDNSCNTTIYTWSPAASLSNSNIKSPLAFPQITTTYTVTVSDNGNIRVDSTVVMVNLMLEDTASILFSNKIDDICYADFDNDDDLDAIVAERVNGYLKQYIYRNDNGIFIKLSNSFLDSAVVSNEFESIDFNNDGMMDYVCYTAINPGTYIRFYKNTGNFNFVKLDSLPMTGSYWDPKIWVDINNDGFMDLLRSGRYAFISKNTDSLRYENIEIIGDDDYSIGDFDILDYDNDGFMDIVSVSSSITYYSPINIYRNINGEYFENTLSFDSVRYGIIHCADLNNDGFSDIITRTRTLESKIKTMVFINNTNGSFDYSSSSEVFQLGNRFTIETSDYDNDGDLDVSLSGRDVNGYYFSIYKNDGNGTFTKDEAEEFENKEYTDFKWLDYDNDGDLDLSIFNSNSPYLYYNHYLYNNISSISNNPPSAPTNVAYDSINNRIVWNPSVDDISPTATLSYNIAVGFYMDSVNFGSPMANLATGYRKTVGHGNLGNDTFAILNLPYDSTFYIRIQAIDQAFAGSQFSQVFQFIMSPLVYTSPDTTILCGGSANLSAAVVNGDTAGFTYTWTPVSTLSTINGNNTIASPLQSTWYKVMVTNANGYLHYDSIFVDIEPLTISVGDIALSCGDSSLVNAEINSNSSSIIYNWTPGTIFSDSTILNPILYSDIPLNATLSATDNNCSDSKNIEITIGNAEYYVDFKVDSANYTYTPFEVEFTNTTPNAIAYNYEWIFGDNSSLNDNDSIIYHSYDNSGYYNVSLVSTNPLNLCTDTMTYENLISCSVVGIQGQTNNVDNLFKIYPNPNKGSFSIEIKDANTEVQAVEIYSVMGKLVYYEGGNRFNNSSIINVSATNIAKGLYFVKITSNDNQYIVKIIRE